MVLSVVIPVRDDKRIYDLIEDLKKQKDVDFEIIVVVNGKGQRNFLSEVKGIRKEYISIESSYVARNKGVLIAKGKYIVFMDSDMRVKDEFLLKKIEDSIDGIDIMKGKLIMTGKVKDFIVWEFGIDDWRKFNMQTKDYGIGFSVIRKDIFYEVGVFLPVITAGDTEFISRLKRYGFKISYNDKLSAEHYFGDSIYWDIWKRWERYGTGSRILVMMLPEMDRWIWYDILMYIGNAFKVLFKGIKEREFRYGLVGFIKYMYMLKGFLEKTLNIRRRRR